MPNDFSITQGQHKNINLTAQDENGDVIATDRVWFTTKKDFLQSSVVIEKSSHDEEEALTDDEIEITDVNNGESTVKFIPEDTKTLSVGYYKYDVWVRVAVSEQIVPIVENGNFIIVSAITTKELS
jgi:hypothetical protein